jgi:hypothetical protein
VPSFGNSARLPVLGSIISTLASGASVVAFSSTSRPDPKFPVLIAM